MTDDFCLFQGDSRVVLKRFSDNSVDSVVTDPPYELGFMGKSWDASGVAYDVELWREVLRVLKPGGHLLAFSGSRTYHRMAVAIEDAGFEIRDQIMWIYGSGFPKSLDVSKAIDKSDAAIGCRERDLKFTAWMRSTGISSKLINEVTQSNMASHYLTDKEQPTVATAEMFDKLRPYLPEVPEWVEGMLRARGWQSENYKKRPITGVYESPAAAQIWVASHGLPADLSIKERRDIPATIEAKQWQGWGTALKPAHEPIVLARKPLIGTVAENVLTYGTGALNIDGGRVGSETMVKTASVGVVKSENLAMSGPNYEREMIGEATGRWPANIIHDGSDRPMSQGKYGRFFYCAKASKKDRNEGLDGFEEKRDHDGRNEGGVGGSNPRNRTNNYRQNHHPTVKPTTLMEYLCKLVTPPNGIVLDPFMGSGSTGKGAIYAGFNFIGIEMTEEYLPIARARIEFALSERQGLLF